MSTVGKNPSDSEPPDLAAILRDIAGLREDIATLARGVTKDIGESVVSRGGQAAKAVGHKIDEQPALSLLIAFAAGVLGTRLLWR